MSISFGINIKIMADYNEKNIKTILENGLQKKFVYFSHNPESVDNEKIDITTATDNIIHAYQTNYEYGPAVYVFLTQDSTASLWFYKTNEGYILFSIGAFSGAQKKDSLLDFGYYVPLFLELCNEFPIIEVKTDMF